MATDKGIAAALENLKKAIIDYNVDAAKAAAQTIVDKGIDPLSAIEKGIRSTAVIISEKFNSGECFLPHLVMAGDAMSEAGKILEGALPQDALTIKKVVVIGTVEADMHSVGKDIVAMMLRTGGFEVHDLGVNVKSSAFVTRARETSADIIALSSLMTTTRPYQREVIEELESIGLRDRFKIIVGGGPVNEEWAREIGADGHGMDAVEAVAVARRVLGVKT